MSKKYSCNACGKNFADKRCLERHIRNEHMDLIESMFSERKKLGAKIDVKNRLLK